MNQHNIIEIKSGAEYQVFVDDPKNLCDESKFFYPVYRKSAELVEEIVSDFLENEGDFFETDYHNNIIMYCAERGSGKSSAMYTFANALEQSQKNSDVSEALKKLFDKSMNDYSFSVLSLVDPTIISEQDMFMRIILSKMYSKLRDKWNENLKCRSSLSSENIQDDKIHRANIVKRFMKCYRYLDVIYQRGGKFDCDDDLEDLTDLGDSGQFRREFRKLVKDFLSEMTGRCPKSSSVMVIPIDDADLNSKMAFNIVEDIRKYCIIPNVIILMAVDIEQMHYVLEQHFTIDFKTLLDASKTNNIKIKTVDMLECHRMAMRYADKVLPAVHQIHLPTVDDFIRNSSSTLTVKYYSEKDRKRYEILDFKTIKNDEKITDYQELLLRLIYNKTGIALVKPQSYLHSMLPRTMRGLSHFLAYICALPDLDKDLGITEIYEFNRVEVKANYEKATGKTYSDAKAELRKRLDNLEAFKQYFLKDWCTVRLSKKHCDAIEIVDDAADELKIPVASNLIDEKLFPEIDTSIDNDFDPPLSLFSYAYIQKKLSKLSWQAHEMDDASEVYMFIYAMRMYFMLFFNRLLLTCVNIGSFEKLLTNVNLEVWSPFNGKLEEHTVDMMFGRFTVDYNLAQKCCYKVYSEKVMERYLETNAFISENGKNSRYVFESVLSRNKAKRSLDKASGVKLICDYGTSMLYEACEGKLLKPQENENVFMIRNALWTLLSSYDLQHYAEKCSIDPISSIEQKQNSLQSIFKGLENINYLPISWSEINQKIPDDSGIKALQLANKNVVVKMIEGSFEAMKDECNSVSLDKTLIDDRQNWNYDFMKMIDNLNAIKTSMSKMSSFYENIKRICVATESLKGKKTTGATNAIKTKQTTNATKVTKIAKINFFKILSEHWGNLCKVTENYDPYKILELQDADKQNDIAINEVTEIVKSFIQWHDYINLESTKTIIINWIKSAFEKEQ